VAAVVVEPVAKQADLSFADDGSALVEPMIGPGFSPVRMFQPRD
jgi:hypothetical protein